MYALGELAVMYPVTGGYYIYASRFIHPGWGFALGKTPVTYADLDLATLTLFF